MQDPKTSPKIAIWAPSHNFVGLYLRNYSMYRQSEKNLLSSNISSTCPCNMANFGPLVAEILALVWGTPGNFNGFRVLAALLHGNLVVGVSQTAALNRGRHLYSAGRPSRWTFAHISSFCCFLLWIISIIAVLHFTNCKTAQSKLAALYRKMLRVCFGTPSAGGNCTDRVLSTSDIQS